MKLFYALFISATAICSHTVAQEVVQTAPIPQDLGDCTLTLICKKQEQDCTYHMGYSTPMPKLKIFVWQPSGATAELSFDSVGDGCAVHFTGTLTLKKRVGNTYTFSAQGEMLGFEGEPRQDITATPHTIIITLNPEV